ncbi:MAG: DUF6262 family protein [Anaerovoracaceae bacterium]
MNNKVPQAVKDKQEMARQTTVHAVLTAIRELQEQGYAIKIKDLMEYTGFSRSTFGKPHVREVLVRCGVVPGKVTVTEEIDTKALLSTTKRLKAELKSKDERIAKLRSENTELKQECELLRGRLFLIMQR